MRRELLHVVGELLAELLVAHFAASQADDREVLGEQSFGGEVEKGGDQLTLGEVSGRAEDHHDRGRRWLAGLGNPDRISGHVFSLAPR